MYIDLDVGCRRSLDNLRRLPHTSVVLPATSPWGLSNDFMMAPPEHPFFIFLTGRSKSKSNLIPLLLYCSIALLLYTGDVLCNADGVLDSSSVLISYSIISPAPPTTIIPILISTLSSLHIHREIKRGF